MIVKLFNFALLASTQFNQIDHKCIILKTIQLTVNKTTTYLNTDIQLETIA